MFCDKCGRHLADGDKICPLCLCAVDIKDNSERADADIIELPSSGGEYTVEINASGGKSRLVGGFLQVFMGALGIGRFYLGYPGTGMLQIAVSLVSCGIGGFAWGLADGIRILGGKVDKDGWGNALAD